MEINNPTGGSPQLPPKYFDLKVDVAFKHIFGRIENKHILAHFLNCVLPKGVFVADITAIIDSRVLRFGNEERGIDFDVYCLDKAGQQFIVEMQNNYQINFVERMLFYTSRAVVNQAKKGAKWKFEVKPVHFVGILDFMIESEAGADDTVLHVNLKTESNKILTKKVSYSLVQLPLFFKEIEEVQTDLESWLYLFKNLDSMRKIPAKLKNSIFEEVIHQGDLFTMNPELRQRWEEGVKRQRDYQNQIAAARLQGEQKGRQEGRQEGEQRLKQQIVLTMQQNGYSTAAIMAITGLSEEEIKAL